MKIISTPVDNTGRPSLEVMNKKQNLSIWRHASRLWP